MEDNKVAEALGAYVRRAYEATPKEDRPSLRAMARRAGISRTMFQKVLDGEGPRNPSARLLAGLAKALGRPEVELRLLVAEAGVYAETQEE